MVTYRWIAAICRREIQRAGRNTRAGTEYRWASAIMCDIGRVSPLSARVRVQLAGANYPDWSRAGLNQHYAAAKAIVEQAIERIGASIRVEVHSCT